MTNINFDYELPSGTTLNVEAEIVSEGRPAKINCLPEDAYPAEDPEIEIVSCQLDDGHGEAVGYMDVTGIWFRKYKSTDMVEVSEHMKDMAWDAYQAGK